MGSSAASDDEEFSLGSFMEVSLLVRLDSSTCLTRLLQEPASFRPAEPEPTCVPYQRRALGGVGSMVGESVVQVGLVSGHPLWGTSHGRRDTLLILYADYRRACQVTSCILRLSRCLVSLSYILRSCWGRTAREKANEYWSWEQEEAFLDEWPHSKVLHR